MYKTVSEYLGSNNKKPVSNLMEPYKYITKPRENFVPQPRIIIPPSSLQKTKTHSEPYTEIKWRTEQVDNMSDPKIWGPPFWFNLHMCAANYPEHASPIVKDRMKARILAIPYEIPCLRCKPHASAFIEQNRKQLDDICSCRDKLFKFYVDFHNKVNQRYNKPIMSYEDAWKLYLGKTKINRLTYK